MLFLEHVDIENDSIIEIVLKGHLVLESMLNTILREYFPSPEFYDDARLTFYQKLNLVRAKHWREQNNDIWPLVKKINKLRNDMAHGLDKDRIKESLKKVLDYQLQIENDLEQIDSIKKHNETHQLVLAFGLIDGFLRCYIQDSELLNGMYRKVIDSFERTRKS